VNQSFIKTIVLYIFWQLLHLLDIHGNFSVNTISHLNMTLNSHPSGQGISNYVPNPSTELPPRCPGMTLYLPHLLKGIYFFWINEPCWILLQTSYTIGLPWPIAKLLYMATTRATNTSWLEHMENKPSTLSAFDPPYSRGLVFSYVQEVVLLPYGRSTFQTWPGHLVKIRPSKPSPQIWLLSDNWHKQPSLIMMIRKFNALNLTKYLQ